MIKKPRGKQEDKKEENKVGRKIKRLWQYRNPHKETREEDVGPRLVCADMSRKHPGRKERWGGCLSAPQPSH